MEKLPTVLLRPGEADRVVAGHPWIYTSTRSRLAPFGQDAGYHSIFTPPPVSASQFSGIRMDTSRLAIEWLVIGTVTGAAYFFSSKKTEPPPNKS